MSKKYINNIAKSLSNFMESYNFKFLKKEKCFIGFNGLLVFRCSFDTKGYGSRLEFHLAFDSPTIETDMKMFPQHYFGYGNAVDSTKWTFEDFDLDFISEDIKFVFSNYFYHLISREINMYDISEKYIQGEYYIRYRNYLKSTEQEDPGDDYGFEFLDSGKSSSDWTEADSKICQELTKKKQDKEFPYETTKKELLHNMKTNKPIYDETIKNIFGESDELKFDKNVFSTSAEEIYQNVFIQEVIKKYGFTHNPTRNTCGELIFGDTIYFKRDDGELLLVVAEKLFLEFIINLDSHPKRVRVNVFDGGYFWFGWLVGDKGIRDENIKEAVKQLELTLQSMNLDN